MRRLPPLAAVRVFEAAGRHENFTNAAAELGMTQAAVSYQVRLLEERLGAPLFVREKGRARLSPLGARLLPTLTQALDSIDAAFAAHRVEDESLLTVATTFTFANTWLAWRLGAFQVEHPGIAVRLMTGNSITDLHGGEADIAIRAGAQPWEGLVCEPLMRIDFTPMCTPSFLAATEARLARKIEPADLLSLPMISPDDPWWGKWFDAAGVKHEGRRPVAGLRLDSQADEGHAAMGGQGVVLLTPEFWKNDMRDRRLVQIFPLTATAGFRYWLVYPEHRRKVPKIRHFREWLIGAIPGDHVP
ncbi:LysR family transcriptional regulator [Sphingomonas sp. HDW15A]|uniref:LysR substrate-binding domain-containing protein n=1 Tax=Sphingomonas sp. HDW15A TaxID=2714942 RepID=UPI00140ADA1B|nr:LysR substrate-binding domain-containing protein [Sphingomonas sp. HDW15A]QIK96321.1 LysR family transcriptional regulator [Sphingomonas sp. HDW15A]